MRKLKLFFACLLMAVLSIGQVWATAYISYDGDTQDASTTISTSNVSSGEAGAISWTGTSCSYSSNRVNIAANGSIAFTATTGKIITKIVITSGSSEAYYGTWTSSPSVTPSKNGGVTTFDGLSANSVTVTTSTAFRCTNASDIKIYYTDGEEPGGGGQGGGTSASADVTLSGGTFADSKITWTIADGNITISQLKGTSSTAVNSSYISAPRVYKGHILSFEATNGYKISSISIKCDGTNIGNSMTAGTAISNNTVTDNTTAVSRTWATASGGTHVVSSVSEAGLSAIHIQNVATTNVQLRPTKITITYIAPSSGKNPAGLAYSTNNYKVKKGTSFTSPTVTNPNGLTVSYASDNASAVEVNATSGAITIHTVGKAVITASSEATDQYEAGSASYTVYVFDHEGTAADPYSVADARRAIDWNYGITNVYAAGKVSEIVDAYSSQYHNISYNFSADGTTTADQLEAFRGKGKDGANFTSENDVLIGDEVVVYGSLTKYGSTYEFAADNQLYSRKTKAALSWNGVTANSFAAELNGENDFPTLVNTNSVSPIAYTSSNHDVVEVISAAGVPTLKAVGQTIITASFEGNTNYLANEVSYTLNVTETILKGDITYECNGATSGCPSSGLTDQTNLPENLPAVTKDGYNFGGWYKTSTFETESKVVGGEAITEDVTLYAKWNEPYTVAEARNAIDAGIGVTGVYAKGIVSEIVTAYDSEYGNISYNISSDGETTSNQLLVFRGFDKDGAWFTSADDVQVGDEVVVYGNMKNYKGTYEFDANNQRYSYKRKDNAELSWGIEEFTAYISQDNTYPTLTNDHNVEVTYSSSETDYATIDPSTGVITLVASGNTTITATFEGDDYYKAAEVSYTLKVRTPIVHGKITYEENGGSTVDDVDDATELPDPLPTTTKALHTFVGWFTDAEFNTPAVAGASLTGDVTLFAKWEEIPSWAYTYTSNIALEVDDNDSKAYAEKVKITVEEVLTEFPALRAATGSAAGVCHVIVPAQTQKLHFHAAAWNGKSSTVTVKMGGTTLLSQALTYDAGIANSSPYTLQGNAYEYYYSIDLSGYNLTEETTITFSAGSDKRFVLFGVNQEGGIVPELDHIVVSGELTNKDYEVGDELITDGLTVTAYYTLAGADHHNEVVTDVDWSYDPLIGGQTSVDVTATYEGKSKTETFAINPVIVPDPEIILSQSTWAIGTVDQNAVVNVKEITVTLKSVDEVTIELSGNGAGAYTLNKNSLTATGTFTISVNTAEAGSFPATITITDVDGNADSKSLSLSMTVKQSEAQALQAIKWVVATEVYDGMQVLITGVKGETTYAMSTQANNNRLAVAGTMSNNEYVPGDGAKAFTLVKQAGENKYAIMTSNGEYLYAASSSNNHLKTRENIEDDDGKAVWTISIGEGNVASIVANCTTTAWRNVMQYNSNSSTLFSCYASANQAAIKLYTPKVENLRENLTDGKWGTICPKNDIYFMEGASFYTLTYMEMQGDMPYKLFFDEIETDYLEGGKPYLFIAEGETIMGVRGANAAEAQNYNGFYGNISGSTIHIETEQNAYIAGNDVINYYGLTNNTFTLLPDGTTVQHERAVVQVKNGALNCPEPVLPAPARPGARRVVAGNNAPAVATGCDEINASEVPVKVMINGQLFIIRGEKMFDATGRLVK